MRRVVVTGISMITPLGGNLKHSWKRIIEGESGIVKIPDSLFDTSDLPAKIAGLVPEGDEPYALDISKYVSGRDKRKMDTFIAYAIAAAEQVLEDSGWRPETEEGQLDTGVLIGSGIGGLKYIAETTKQLIEEGARHISPFFIPASIVNLASGHVSIKYGFKGPNLAVSTACSTGAHAIGEAAWIIKRGDAKVMIAGGTEAAVSKLGIAGFAAAKALSTNFNDTPAKASRPWDAARDGFVMGDGCGLVVLEELEHAKARNAKIYAELIGYGLTSDAYHITAPDGNGGLRSMQAALRHAGLAPADIDYINAHGTSTPVGDEIELNTIKQLFAGHTHKLKMSSTKSAIGHLLGAAGSVEAIFSILAIANNIIPPTLNLDNPSVDSGGIDLVPHFAKEASVNVALTNSFGFGGTNSTLIFRKYQ
jgi:3-oxoacyl-[acyl-carrier-protein] synthase II